MDSRPALNGLHPLSQRMGEYYYLMETYSSKLRQLPDLEALHEALTQEWSGFMQPPQGDKEKKKEYFKHCDSICYSNPTTPHGYVIPAPHVSMADERLLNQVFIRRLCCLGRCASHHRP